MDRRGTPTAPKVIKIVDRVITRNSTSLAMSRRRRGVSPQAESRRFAVIRTMSGAESDQVMSPVEGMISSGGTHLFRQP